MTIREVRHRKPCYEAGCYEVACSGCGYRYDEDQDWGVIHFPNPAAAGEGLDCGWVAIEHDEYCDCCAEDRGLPEPVEPLYDPDHPVLFETTPSASGVRHG